MRKKEFAIREDQTEQPPTELVSQVDTLTEERDELLEAIQTLRGELSELRGNFREAEITYREKSQEMRDQFVKDEDAYRSAIHKLAKRCADETAKYEHEYHNAREVKGSELAVLETRIAMLKTQESDLQAAYKLNESAWKKVLDAKDREMKTVIDNKERDYMIVVAAKDSEIERQHRIIMELTRHIGNVAIPNFASAPIDGVQGNIGIQGTQGIRQQSTRRGPQG